MEKQAKCSLQEKIIELNSIKDSLGKVEEDLEDEINDTFSSISVLLEERRTNILSQLRSKVGGKCQRIEAQLEEMNKMMKGCEADETDDISLVETPHVTVAWDGLEEMKQLSSSLGQVLSSSCIPSLSTVDGEGCRRASIMKQTLVTLTTRDSSGEVTPGPGLAQISCHIEPLLNIQPHSLPRLIQMQVIFVSSGEYDIIYSLPKEGRYKVWVRIYKMDVKNSPFIVTCLPETPTKRSLRSQSSSLPRSRTSSTGGPAVVRSRRSTPGRRPLSSLSWSSWAGGDTSDILQVVGGKGRGLGQFMNPQGVGLTYKGDILVTDSNNQCVQMFSSSGILISKWGTRGRLPGQLQRPIGIVVTKGLIAVSDYDNKCVSLFDMDGHFQSRIGAGKMLGPKGITTTSEGDIIVIDNKGCSVFVFTPEGKTKTKFGSRGSAAGQLAGPHYVAVNSHGNILISDFHNHCVKAFTSEGLFLFSFGSNGEGNGQFSGPTGLAVDSQDNIIVADWGNARVQIFDQFGSFLSYINTGGCKLYGPQGVAVSDGNIVLADTGNHCVKTYRYFS